MTGDKLLVLLFLLTSGLCAGQDLQQAMAEIAQGGQNVCKYCQYCALKGNCPCTNADCADVCVEFTTFYNAHCNTTCKHLCQANDTCQPGSCGVNATCVERTPNKASCLCKVGHIRDFDPQCAGKGLIGDCDFYNCFNNRKNCGPDGYLLKYGHKYCTRFNKFKDQFTTDGQTMIDCVGKCLTNALFGYYQLDHPAGSAQICQEVKNVAFSSHVGCYEVCDFCHVWSHNKAALNTVYKYSDFFSSQAIKQVAIVATKCANTTYHDIISWISSKFASVPDIQTVVG